MALDIEAARRAITDKVAKPLGMSLIEAAWGIREVLDARMADLLRRSTIERGHDPREFTLLRQRRRRPLACLGAGARARARRLRRAGGRDRAVGLRLRQFEPRLDARAAGLSARCLRCGATGRSAESGTRHTRRPRGRRARGPQSRRRKRHRSASSACSLSAIAARPMRSTSRSPMALSTSGAYEGAVTRFERQYEVAVRPRRDLYPRGLRDPERARDRRRARCRRPRARPRASR